MIWPIVEGVLATFGASVFLTVVVVRAWIIVDDYRARRQARRRRRQWERP